MVIMISSPYLTILYLSAILQELLHHHHQSYKNIRHLARSLGHEKVVTTRVRVYSHGSQPYYRFDACWAFFAFFFLSFIVI